MLATSSLLKDVFSNQCGPRSPRSSLIQVPNVCLYGDISHLRGLLDSLTGIMHLNLPGLCPLNIYTGY